MKAAGLGGGERKAAAGGLRELGERKAAARGLRELGERKAAAGGLREIGSEGEGEVSGEALAVDLAVRITRNRGDREHEVGGSAAKLGA